LLGLITITITIVTGGSTTIAPLATTVGGVRVGAMVTIITGAAGMGVGGMTMTITTVPMLPGHFILPPGGIASIVRS